MAQITNLYEFTEGITDNITFVLKGKTIKLNTEIKKDEYPFANSSFTIQKSKTNFL
jgi:hypothetical protein